MKLTMEEGQRLGRFMDAGRHALNRMRENRCSCGSPDCVYGTELKSHIRQTELAYDLVGRAIYAGSTDKVSVAHERRADVEMAIREASRVVSFQKVVAATLAGVRRDVASEVDGFFESAQLFTDVLRAILEASSMTETVTAVQGGTLVESKYFGPSPMGVMREQLAAASRAFAAGASEVVFRPGKKVEPLEPAGRMTGVRLYQLMRRVACDLPLFANLGWEGDSIDRGHIITPTWRGVDSETGEQTKLTGAKFFVSRHAADNEVVQAMLKAVIAAAEHEVREHFKFDGVAIYRPHQPLAALWDFTASTPPETREEVPAK